MSLANLAKFFYKMDHDEKVKAKVDAVVFKYNAPESANTSRREIIEKELIPIGKEIGLDFTIEEFMQYVANPSLQKIYETARVVGGSPNSKDFGARIAANVAKKSIINTATKVANDFYQENYAND